MGVLVVFSYDIHLVALETLCELENPYFMIVQLHNHRIGVK